MNENDEYQQNSSQAKTPSSVKRTINKGLNTLNESARQQTGTGVFAEYNYYKTNTTVEGPSKEYKDEFKREYRDYKRSLKTEEKDKENDTDNTRLKTVSSKNSEENRNPIENRTSRNEERESTQVFVKTSANDDSYGYESDDLERNGRNNVRENESFKLKTGTYDEPEYDSRQKIIDETDGYNPLKTSVAGNDTEYDTSSYRVSHSSERIENDFLLKTGVGNENSYTTDNKINDDNNLKTTSGNSVETVVPVAKGYTETLKTAIGNNNAVNIMDETGNTVSISPGEAVMLSNGAMIGVDMDETGNIFVFSNYFDRSRAASLDNNLKFNSEDYVANGMTLKTAVNENSNSIMTVEEVIGTNGTIITINFDEQMENMKRLATEVSSNDQRNNAMLTMSDKELTKLKLKTGAIAGASIMIRGVAIGGKATVSFASLMAEGMSTNKDSAEFAIDKSMNAGKNMLSKAEKIAWKKISNSAPATAIKSRTGNVLAIIKSKAGTAFKNSMMKTTVTSRIYRAGSTISRRMGVIGRISKSIGRIFTAVKKTMLKLLFLLAALLLVMALIICAVGGVVNGITSIFGFLFPNDENLYEKYKNYIMQVNGYVETMNANYTNGNSEGKHIIPIYGTELDASSLNSSLSGKDYITLTENVSAKAAGGEYTNDLHSFEYGKQILTVDDSGNLVATESIQDTATFSGVLNGVNWRAFLACTQIYSGLTNDLDETLDVTTGTALDAMDPDNPRPYQQFKNEFNGGVESSDFVMPHITIDVTAYYTDNNGTVKENNLTNSNDEGDQWYTASRYKREGYFVHKKLVEEYNQKKAEYDADQAEWVKRRDTMKTKEAYEINKNSNANNPEWMAKYDTYEKYKRAVEAGELYGPTVAKPDQPSCSDGNHIATYEQMVNEVNQPAPPNVYHHYKVTYQMADKSDHSLQSYQDWFKYNMYETASDGTAKTRELTDDEQEMLDMLYASETIFSGFDDEMQTILSVTPGGIITPIDITITGDSETGVKIAEIAASVGGARYWWGMSGPTYFDCSGLVYYCYNSAGVNIERSSANVYGHSGQALTRDQLQAGDIIAIGKNGKYTHIGIYAGNNQVIHAGGGNSSTHGDDPNACVKVTTLDKFIGGSRSDHAFRRLY